MMNDSGRVRVAAALANLAPKRPSAGQYAQSIIGPFYRPHEVALAKDSFERIHLLVELPDGVKKFDLSVGEVLPAQWTSVQGTHGREILDVTCVEEWLVDTFASLVGEMLDRVDATGHHAVDELREVIDAWRLVLHRQVKSVSKSHIVGLFGELTVLERMAAVDPTRAMKAWRGKDGYRHDFYLTNALEVKTYTTLNSPQVSIHGAYQLDPPPSGSLHLATFRVDEDPNGLTIQDLLDRIHAHGVSSVDILSRSNSDAPIIVDEELRFSIGEERLYFVGPDFPGVRASRLREADLQGVSGLKFGLHLDACPDKLSSSDLPVVLAAL
ncbi:PD-(D/E)XK motif protein [Microbacterium sp. NC79]|uniref:PD-(D/E)XK motif protein n=1 Tax=Microbacterium sp. NC79 TaxID=2851009 RepID=UPI001C2BEFF0|nr:PD-(D/E)XK motif protein [Microbacterium sp. NC79]MBV0895970.1 PD-(D/E)XK motif protein [Microbacterium sp. NC79]